MENDHEFYFRSHLHGSLKDAESESSQRFGRKLYTILGSMIAFILLLFLNDTVTKNSQVKGLVMSIAFLKEEWVGPPSMFGNNPNMMSSFTYLRPDSFEVMVRIDSGELVRVLCFKCNASSYKLGDTIEIIRKDRMLGSAKYKEL